MANPVLVEVTRGPIVESRHRGTLAIADSSGTLLASLGDVDAPVFPRSSIKMIQALPLVESGAAEAFDLTSEYLALACASHSGETMHVDRVAAWLMRIDAHESDLACGPHWPNSEAATHALVRAERQPCRLHNNCSGKHSGFLTLARHLNAPLSGYTDTAHPVQLAVMEALASVAQVPVGLWSIGIDGCAAPNFALPVAVWARAMARLASGHGLAPLRARAAQRITAAMRQHPELVSGTGRACARLMRVAQFGTTLKTGAEGVYFGIVEGRGLGIALKIDDGATRASETAIASVLTALCVLDPTHPDARAYLRAHIPNTNGLPVGERRPAEALAKLQI